MPVYEYRCDKGHEYEKTEGFNAPSEQPCAKCGVAARRKISMPAVIFKGSGFYSTDNRRGSAGGNGVTTGKPASESPSHNDGDGHSHDSKVEATAD